MVILLLSLVLPLGGSKNHTVLSTMLKEPLWTLAVAAALCGVAPIPREPLRTLTTGNVDIPRATSVESLIVPSGRLENPTCSTFIYSLSTFKTSLGWIELIPLSTNWDVAAPILASNVWLIAVNEIGCWTIPSRPITVLLNLSPISIEWALPSPTPVNVIAAPAVIYSFLLNNWNLLSLITLA